MSEPLTPEDQKLLLDFAGPLFAESKEIDSMYFSDMKTKVDGMADSGIARGIQNTLERDFALAQAQRRAERNAMIQEQLLAQQLQAPPQAPPVSYDIPVAHNPPPIPATIAPVTVQSVPTNVDLSEMNKLLERQAVALENLNKIFEKFVKLLSKNAES